MNMIILLVIAAIAVSLPVAGIVLVSLASRREDAAQSLSTRPSGAIQIAARRVVGFHGNGLARRPARRGGSRPARARRGPEDDPEFAARLAATRTDRRRIAA
ncbi:MAG TPA: hypothetical protein VFV41_19595 [Streptosporangiaceae bacterium]|nr:hypothetical protein [Streptosporangiaceae bacterium]